MLKKIKLRNVEINQSIFLAPMSGVTDKPFRTLVSEYGVGMIVSEMVASRAMIIQTRQSMQKCALVDGKIPESVQLAGCNPIDMADAARLNRDLGAKVIDINFGCPAKKVVGGYAGSALMKDERLATDILREVVRAVPELPVTLKMRMGWNSENLNAPKLARIAENEGIELITVHGRTRAQFYRGNADWEFIHKVKNSVTIPVIANGDIKSADDAKQALELSGADGVMVGRGCYGKPWLIKVIADKLSGKEIDLEPNLQDKLDIILKHYDLTLSHYGIESGLKIARKHISWYSSSLPKSAEFRDKITRMDNATEVINTIKDYFNHIMNLSPIINTI